MRVLIVVALVAVSAQAQEAILISQMRALTLPLILDDANTVAHVVWRDGALVDLKGNAWIMNGTVPQVARTATTTAGAGAFSDANYYSFSPGSVLDFAGDFSGVIVYTALSSTASNGLVSKASAYGASGAGWRLMENSTGPTFDTLGPGGAYTRAGDIGLLGLNVVCFGRSGSTMMLKVNLRAIVTQAGALNVQASGEPGRIGRYAETGVGADSDNIYEVWLSSTTVSDALCTAKIQGVKERLGITAW